MKSFIVFSVLIAAALAAPASYDGDSQIVNYESENNGVAGYRYVAQTSNGIAVEEQGELTLQNSEEPSNFVRGSFSYVGDDGKTYSVSYVADENGFRPEGAHLPVA